MPLHSQGWGFDTLVKWSSFSTDGLTCTYDVDGQLTNVGGARTET